MSLNQSTQIQQSLEIENTKTFLDEQEIVINRIKTDLNVMDPVLLKTGAMGNLVNLITHAKLDNKIFLKDLTKQLNPVIADKFGSLAFHCSLNNYDISFANPSEYSIQFILDDIDFSNSYIDSRIKYIIEPNTFIQSENDLEFTLEDKIEIIQTKNGIIANCFDNNTKTIYNLEVIKTINPQKQDSSIFLINYGNLKQYKRKFYSFSLYDSININMEKVINSYNIDDLDISTIHSINCWKREINLDEPSFYLDDKLKQYISSDFKEVFNLIELDTKYNNYISTADDDHVFIELGNNNIKVISGNGINGKKANTGEYIIIEIKTTVGKDANDPFIKKDNFIFGDVTREIVSSYDSSIKNINKVDIKAISIQGGVNGTNSETITEIQTNLANVLSSRNNITTINDYIYHFTKYGIEPFVDIKYFNTSNNYFIYNIFRFGNDIIKTTTKTLNESELKDNLFFPKFTYNDKELFSPFYYKKERNKYEAYSIDKEIYITLDSNIPSYDNLRLNNNILCKLMYNFKDRKSYIQISNFSIDNIYEFSCNQFKFNLSNSNAFSQEIPVQFLDDFCLLLKPIKDIKINVFDSNANLLINYISRDSLLNENKYFQLQSRQSNFIYFDNNTNNSTTLGNVLNLPFMDLEYFDTIIDSKVGYSAIKDFFTVKEDNNLFAPNIRVTQSFYNTIDIDNKYNEYVFEFNDNGTLLSTENLLKLELLILNKDFILSEYSNITDLEIDIRNEIGSLLYNKNGFKTDFYETEIETHIKNKFNFIKNISIKFPRKFKVNDTAEIYYKMEEALIDNKITMMDVINFTPFYIYYNSSFITIDTKLI